ncbi:MAG: hypothetical protein DRQ78_09835 [Epsilonproteobacteria bacterium]|nr:MAG: hypothetical protein DRQ78_09835 [Campylobacterota bacterium]
MRIRNLLFTSIAFTSLSYAQEDSSMDELLDTFVHNSDLSEKTKLANAGNVTVITREEIERRQARNLRDILKSLSLLNYAESRFGIPDPDYLASSYPFSSNSIRIYIDDQEVSTAAYGSGLFHLGDIDIGFVDHIEVYTLNPSFEHSTEPARFLIKLYSKDAKRDKGAKVSVSAGSRGFNQESAQYANTVDDVSYFSYASRTADKRERHKSFDVSLSRDQERYFIFNKISTKTQNLQLHAIKNSKDTFMGISNDGRTKKATINTRYLHIGYENTAIENFKFSTIYENGKVENDYANDFRELRYNVKDKILTINAQYKYDKIKDNELIIGAKYRYKNFTVSDFHFNNIPFPPADYDTQEITSFYIEDQYTLNSQWLLSLGGQFGKINNNASIKDQDMSMARLGLVYSNEHWVAKTFLHRSSFFPEPYLYVDTLARTDQESIEPEMIHNITQEFEYKQDDYTLRTVLGYSYKEDALIIKSGALQNKDSSESEFFALLEHQYIYDKHNTLNANFSYIHSRNIDTNELSDGLDEYKVVLQLLSHYDKFSIFNELIYNHNSAIEDHFLDYSAGIKYQYSQSLVLSLKGENIFDTAREDYFERGERNLSTGKWDTFEPLYIAPIDQKIYFTMEYFF